MYPSRLRSSVTKSARGGWASPVYCAEAAALSSVSRSVRQARIVIVRPTIGVGPIYPHDVFHALPRNRPVAVWRLKSDARDRFQQVLAPSPQANKHAHGQRVE